MAGEGAPRFPARIERGRSALIIWKNWPQRLHAPRLLLVRFLLPIIGLCPHPLHLITTSA